MTDNERIGAKLAEMGTDVRRAVTPPPPGAVRRRAEHQQRVRRTAAAALAATAVLAIAVGAVSAVRGSATPPPPPGTTPTLTPSSPAPRPTPSWPERKIADPIAATDWTKATITLPAQDGCPSGRVQFARGDFGARSSGWPQVLLEVDRNIAYGDLTGDGRSEAILRGMCLDDAQDSGDGKDHLLVVTREGDRLRALGWVGPRGSIFVDYWVEDKILYSDVHPWHDTWQYTLGAARAWRWTGSAFVGHDGRYRGLGIDGPVDLRPLAGRTGCPAPVLSFGADGRATGEGVIFDVQQAAPDGLAHLVDLEGDGVRRLLIAITCGRRADGIGTTSVVVLERPGAGGYVAIDAIRLPAGTPLADWTYSRGELAIDVAGQVRTYVWDGERFRG